MRTQSAATVLRRDAAYRRTLALGDILSSALALYLAVFLLGDDSLSLSTVATLPLVVVVGKLVGLYDRDQNLLRKSTLDEAPALFQVATLYALLIWLGERLLVQGYLGHKQVLGLWGLLFVTMLLVRALIRGVVQRFVPAERCLVVGDAVSAERVRAKLESSFALKAVVVGRIPLNNAGPRVADDALVVGEVESLPAVLVDREVHRVVLAPGSADVNEILGVIRIVKALGIRVSVLPGLLEVVGSSVEFDDVDGLTLLGLRESGLTRSSQLIKVIMDFVASAVGMIALSPLLLGIALAIRLTSPGPVLFRQRRIGRDGLEFEMLKFRTMVDGAEERKADLRSLNEADGLFKIAEDPRMTRVGRFLRRSSLDELPQLLNVLRREMSLVGPRPLVVDEDRRVSGWHRQRLDLRPGMTGPWQILGSSRIPLHEMVKLDYLYSANWSLWLDVKILLRTIPHVVTRRGL